MNQCFVVICGLLSTCFLLEVMALSDEMKELAQMLHNTCVGETGCPEELIQKVNNEKVFTDDERLKCYIKCLLAQMACIDDDGHIDEEATIAILPEEYQEEAAPVIRACGTKSGANPCDNAWLTHKCYAEMKPDVSYAREKGIYVGISLKQKYGLGKNTYLPTYNYTMLLGCLLSAQIGTLS